MHPPVFQFTPVPGAATYRYTITWRSEPETPPLPLESSTPVLDLAAPPAAGRY